MQGDFAAAEPHLVALEGELLPRLPAADPLRVSVRAMRTCHDALRARGSGAEVDPLVTALDQSDTELASANAADSTRRLVAHTLQVLARP
jgi:hypothetical protein